jgi:hypothetical protein
MSLKGLLWTGRNLLVSGSTARCVMLLDRDSYLFPKEPMVRFCYLLIIIVSLILQGKFNHSKPFDGELIGAVIKHLFFSPSSVNSKLVTKCVAEFTSSLEDAPGELEVPSYFVAVAGIIVCHGYLFFLFVF